MANTYTAIATSVLTSTTTFVDFTSIPQNFTDLLIVASTRNSSGAGEQNIYVRNNIAAFTSARGLEGTGAAVSTNTYGNQGSVPNTTFTANAFNNCEFYIANYTSTVTHQTCSTVVNESNTTTITNGIRITAAVDSETAAITSVRIIGSDFVSGSSFYLYGIKNS